MNIPTQGNSQALHLTTGLLWLQWEPHTARFSYAWTLSCPKSCPGEMWQWWHFWHSSTGDSVLMRISHISTGSQALPTLPVQQQGIEQAWMHQSNQINQEPLEEWFTHLVHPTCATQHLHKGFYQNQAETLKSTVSPHNYICRNYYSVTVSAKNGKNLELSGCQRMENFQRDREGASHRHKHGLASSFFSWCYFQKLFKHKDQWKYFSYRNTLHRTL